MSPEEQVRGHLVEALKADLIGPFDRGSGQEVLPLPPSRWYLTGFLAPRGGGQEPEAGDDEGELAAGSDSQQIDAGSDEPEPKRRQYFPASLGHRAARA